MAESKLVRGLVSVLDADDVLLETGKKKLEFLRERYPDQEIIKGIQPYQCSRTELTPIIGSSWYTEANDYSKSRESTLNTHPLEGALEGVQELSRLGLVYVLSNRDAEEIRSLRERLGGLKLSDCIQGVLSLYSPKYANIKNVTGTMKADIALTLGAWLLVDDDKRHLPDKPVDGMHLILFGKGKDKRNAGDHIYIATDWQRVVDYARKLPIVA